jgi:hypothetical protein
MTKQICYSCGTEMPRSYSTYQCNVCRQTAIMAKAFDKQNKLLEQQNRIAQQSLYNPNIQPHYYPTETYDWSTSYKGIPQPPASAAEIEEAKKTKRLNKLMEVLLWTSPLTVLPLLWLITSGWVTFFAFVLFPFAFVGFGKWHHYWKMSNADHLFNNRYNP